MATERRGSEKGYHACVVLVGTPRIEDYHLTQNIISFPSCGPFMARAQHMWRSFERVIVL